MTIQFHSWPGMLLGRTYLLRESENLSISNNAFGYSLKAILVSQGLYQSSHLISIRQGLVRHLIQTATGSSSERFRINSISSKRITRKYRRLKRSEPLEPS